MINQEYISNLKSKCERILNMVTSLSPQNMTEVRLCALSHWC